MANTTAKAPVFPKVAFPTLKHGRMSKIDVNGDEVWVVVGPQTSLALAIEAGGCHIMTRRGPRTIIVQTVYKLATGLAVRPVEPDFEDADDEVTQKAAAPQAMSEADILKAAAAIMEAREKPAATSTTGRGRKTQTSKPAAAKATEAAPEGAAEVDAEDLTDLLNA